MKENVQYIENTWSHIARIIAQCIMDFGSFQHREVVFVFDPYG